MKKVSIAVKNTLTYSFDGVTGYQVMTDHLGSIVKVDDKINDVDFGSNMIPQHNGNGSGGGYGYVFSVYDYGYALNSLATGNYSSIDKFMYAQLSSGNGYYVPLNGVAGEGVSVMIREITCYGKHSHSYSSSGSGFSSNDYSFTMKSQGDFHTGGGRTRGGESVNGSAYGFGGTTMNVVGAGNNGIIVANAREAYNTCQSIKSGNLARFKGNVHLANMNINSCNQGIKLLSKTGNALTVVTVYMTIKDGITNKDGWEKHHTADLIINGCFVIIASTAGAPIAAVGGLIYFFVDLGYQGFTGKSITEYYFD